MARVLALAVFATSIAACAGLADSSRIRIAGTSSDLNEAVFAEAFTLISERYIEPVAVDRLAMDGLKAIGDADPAITITSTGGKVRLIANNIQIREFPAPGRNDANAWGEVTAAVIRSSRDVSPYLKAMKVEKFYETVFDAAIANLDRYSRYASADEAREHRADREGFGGIGMHLSVVDEVTRIVAVMPGTPAERAGLKDNDIITKVAGASIAGLKLREVVKRLRGRIGSIARFTVIRHGIAQPLEITVERERIIPTSVIYRREGNIAYLRITRFNQGTARSFRESLARARKEIGPQIAGLVVDLRDNPGGLLDQAVAVTDSLLSGGRIVSTRGRHRGSFQQYDASDDDIAEGLPMVLLINGGSASASEIMAAALQDDGRAIIVGSNSYGKGVVQSVYRLPNDGELTLTWSRFHAPSGYNLQDLGVLPTICTSMTKNGETGILLDAVRRDRDRISETLATWRRAARPDKAIRETLRAKCPAKRRQPGEDDHDMEVARAVFGDKALYAIALRQSMVPELARRQ